MRCITMCAFVCLFMGNRAFSEGDSTSFADPALERAVRVALGLDVESLSVEDLLSLTQLAAVGEGIADLGGIERLANLTALDLADNLVEDLAPLAALEHLVLLDLSGNRVQEIGALSGLGALQFMALAGNQVGDIAPLLGLPELSSVELLANPLTRTSVEEHVPALQARGVEVFFDPPEEPGGPGDGPLGDEGPWTSVGPESLQRNLAVYDLAASPSQPEVLYALAENGMWHSADRGETWERGELMFPGLGGRRYYLSAKRTLFVDALDSQTAYFADGPNLLRTRDGGTHWERLAPPDQLRWHAQNLLVSVDCVVAGRLYATAREHLLVSKDAGQSWEETGVALLWDPFVQVADAKVVYAGSWERDSQGFWRLGRVYNSDDGAETWESQAFEFESQAMAPDPRGASSLYAVDRTQVWHSADRGATWEVRGRAPASSIGQLAAHPAQPDLLFAWGFPAGVMWRSVDGGSSWEQKSSSKVKRVTFDAGDPQRGFLLTGGSANADELYATRDGGDQWRRVSLEETALPAETVVVDRAGRLLVGSERQDIGTAFFTSTDQGATWLEQPGAVPRDLASGAIYALQVDPAQPEIVLAHTGRALVRSADAGHTWEKVTTGSGRISHFPAVFPKIAAAPQGSGQYFVMDPSDLGLYRSADRGKTWQEASGDLDEVSAFALDPVQPTVLYAVTYADSRIWRSADGGMSWEEASGIESVYDGFYQPVYDLAIHPLDRSRLYAVTWRGLYVSEDEGETWSPLLDTEAEPWSGSRVRFSPRSTDVVYLVTGRGLFESRDAGRSWADLGESLGGCPWFGDVAVDPVSEAILYAATPRGVYRLDRDLLDTAVIEEGEMRPEVLSLHQNYPNPFNPSTTIAYGLSLTAPVRLTVYGMTGQRLRSLVDQVQMAGEHRIVWDGRDEVGRRLASGVYLYSIRVGKEEQTRRLVLLR